MIYQSDIKDAIISYFGDNPSDFLPVLRDLYEETNEGYFLYVINQVCADNNLCPVCFEPVEIHSRFEYRGDCRGQPAYENIYDIRCPCCGWSKN